MNENEAKLKVVEAGIKLVESGLIARTWGNVSCRISKSHFVITPSGRDYLTITPADIVLVRIDDLSYTGEVKPSGEKAVHAEIYKGRPDINFVIHTHQENASVISTLGLDAIEVETKTEAEAEAEAETETEIKSEYNFIGNKIICADYGLPGTKKLQRAVAAALVKSTGNAIIMKNHGVVCFGIDDLTAFQTAIELEKASQQFILNQLLKVMPEASTEIEAMRSFIKENFNSENVTRKVDAIKTEEDAKTKPKSTYKTEETHGYMSERIINGFILKDNLGNSIEVEINQVTQDREFDQINQTNLPVKTDQSMSDMMLIHRAIYLKNPKINFIVYSKTPYCLAFSETNLTLLPYVDDFAQIIGTKVKTVSTWPQGIANALSQASAVFIQGHGALCSGETFGDALAVQMILEKNCKAKITGLIFGKGKPLNALDTHLMRIVYLKKYAKQIESKSV